MITGHLHLDSAQSSTCILKVARTVQRANLTSLDFKKCTSERLMPIDFSFPAVAVYACRYESRCWTVLSNTMHKKMDLKN